MIRKFEKSDIDQVMQIWLGGNTEAHNFIPESYWLSNFEAVKEQIANADVFVFETGGKIQGFIGITGNRIEGIFVDKMSRSFGIGKQLLDYAKSRYCPLYLGVYRKNRRAVDFYLREGFSLSGEEIDEETGEPEYTMVRRAD